MRVVIEVPEERAEDYIKVVAEQVSTGHTSGYVDSETYWDVVSDERGSSALR